MSQVRLTFKAVDRDRWDDLAALFEAPGGPHSCWCMVWRKKPAIPKDATSKERKSVLKQALLSRVEDGVPIGILGYLKGAPVAWCSVAPRSTYRPLGGVDDPESEEAVWSIVCFFIKRELRGEGVTGQLLRAAIQYASRQGARSIEAYPVDPDSPSYRFMGFVSVFEQAGFEIRGTAGTRRHVMRLKLS